MLRLNGGLRYQEIADLLGISIGAVRSQLFEARACLREKLADRYPALRLAESDH
jgi:DNA-directed RNA polymerase specialized sigma24 family protein